MLYTPSLILINNLIVMKLSYSLFIEDYCQSEKFSPRCKDNEDIIYIEKAIYGRMQVGKCLDLEGLSELYKNDVKFLGCHSDVSDIVANKCFGKQSCDITVTDNELLKLNEVRPCYRSMLMYLSVEYQCMKLKQDNMDCKMKAVTDYNRILISLDISQAETNFCGHVTNPYILEAPLGQGLDIIVNKIKLKNKNYLKNKCSYGNEKLGYIITRSENISLCSSIQLNTSLTNNNKSKNSNLLKFVLFKIPYDKMSTSLMLTNYLILDIKVIGCIDLIPPEDAWLKRNNELATVGCYSSRKSWILRCRRNQWHGVIGNCSMTSFILENVQENRENIQLKKAVERKVSSEVQFLGIVAICGFCIALCIVVSCIGSIYFKRKINNMKKHDYSSNLNRYPNSYNYVNYQNTNLTNYEISNKTNNIENLNTQATEKVEYFVLEENSIK